MNKEVVQELTKDCQSEDCRISSFGSVTTLMNWTTEYDKYGFAVTADPNTVTTTYSCRTCSKRWYVKNCAGNRTVEAAA